MIEIVSIQSFKSQRVVLFFGLCLPLNSFILSKEDKDDKK